MRAGAGREIGGGSRERLTQALDIDQIHALGRGGGIVDIARQGEIDEHELATGGNVGGLDGEVIGAGGGDGKVDVGKRGGALSKVHDAGGNARLLGVAGQALGALAGAVGQHQLLNPQPAGVGGGEGRHGARTKDQRSLAGQVPGVEALQGLVEGERHHGGAGLVDIGLGVHALARPQRGLRQRVNARADRALLGSGLIGAAHLADDLLLAHHHRIQAGGHGHEVLGRGVGIAHVEVVAQLLLAHARHLGEHAHDFLHAGVEGVGDGVDLHAVAGGNNHRL